MLKISLAELSYGFFFLPVTYSLVPEPKTFLSPTVIYS